MARVDVVPAQQRDLDCVATLMRDADKAEALAMAGVGPAEAVRRSAALSHETLAGRVDDETVCIFGLGVGCLLTGVGRPWLLGTDLVERHAVRFLRRNRVIIDRWLDQCEHLENWVDARHRRSITWLAWLGFEIYAAQPFGPYQKLFHRFDMRR